MNTPRMHRTPTASGPTRCPSAETGVRAGAGSESLTDELATLSPEAARQALHELRVHQYELMAQNEELRLAQAELDVVRARYVDLYDFAPVAYCSVSEKGLILEANLAIAALLGETRGALVAQRFSRFIFRDDQDLYCLQRWQRLEAGLAQTCELRLVKKDGTVFWAQLAATAASDAHGAPVSRIVLSDITERKFQEEERELTARLVALVSMPGDFQARLSALTLTLQERIGCEAVGIRLCDSGRYPYYETRGFPPLFVHGECHRCGHETGGEIRPDAAGNLRLECICATVLAGRGDPRQPAFTAQGSFWSNRACPLRVGSTVARDARASSQCSCEGYESVALIPLRAAGQILGLLQLSDHRPDRFTSALMVHLERMADSLAAVLVRGQGEEVLRRSEARHAKMAANIGDVIVIIDKDGINRYKSPNIEKLFGWKPAEVVGRSTWENVHPDDRVAAQAFIGSILGEPGATGTTICRYRCQDGRYRWIEFTGMNMLHDPDIQGILGNYRDITDRKQAEDNLTLFFDLVPDMVCIASTDGFFKRVNRAWEAALGFSPDELLAAPFMELIHPEDREATLVEIQKQTAGGQSIEFANRYRCKNGSYRWLEWVATPATPGGVLYAAARDITERRQAEEALRGSLHEKESLLKEIHHRVKNNLQIIVSLLRLQAARLDNPVAKAALKDMQSRVRSMALIHEHLYRSENLAQVDLAAYLKGLCSQLCRTLVEASGAIRLHTDMVEVRLGIDQAIPCGLLVNELVSNALKHAFPEGRSGDVRVELQPVAGRPGLCLRVADNGVGLPVDFDLAHLTSLGMQLVHDLARQLGGRLAIRPGPGAVFEVTFERK